MARIVHIALKVEDLEKATRFYEEALGLRQTGTGYARGHVSRHMTDGEFDLAIMKYDTEDVHEAQLSGAGPCIHHWGIEVPNRDAAVKLIEANGGTIISARKEGALKFRAPDGTVAEIVGPGRYKTYDHKAPSRMAHLAIKVRDLEAAATFYRNVFGFEEVTTEHRAQRASRHMTDGRFDLSLSSDDGPKAPDQNRSAIGPRLDHWGVEVADPDGVAEKIVQNGGEIVRKSDRATIFRAADGTFGEMRTPDTWRD
jgi:lactoylglutathione lyase